MQLTFVVATRVAKGGSEEGERGGGRRKRKEEGEKGRRRLLNHNVGTCEVLTSIVVVVD